MAAALTAHPRAKVVGIVHAETSTGAHQPLEEISQIVHAAGALFLVDAVTSLGGHELRVDDWRIDACYSGTQKCLSCPPGLAPVTFSAAALEAMDRRKTKVPQLVPRHVADPQLLGRRPRLPPHGADQHDLRPA